MSHGKRGPKVLGLSLLAVLGLTALIASSAQALTWDLDKIEITAATSFDGRLKEELLLLVPALNLIIHCNQLTVEDGLLLLDNTAHLGLVLSQCKTLVKGLEMKACVPEILLSNLKILPFLHNEKIYLLFEPLFAGQPFLVIHFKEECVLPLANATGSVVYECEDGFLTPIDCKTPKISHLIKPANPSLFPGDLLVYGKNPASIHGEAELLLTEKDLGRTFNALI